MAGRTITFLQPNRLTFGSRCLSEAWEYLRRRTKRLHIVSSPSQRSVVRSIVTTLEADRIRVSLDADTNTEPTIALFERSLAYARSEQPDCVLGIGGGSALDLAKLIAAFVRNDQRVQDTFGIGLLSARHCTLVCMPTTSGTGSEVSPNAILLDEVAHLKKGVISPYLVPDAAFIDPLLTHTVPSAVTAATGLDALTHCIEAYTNRYAHPLADLYALEGIRLVARSLSRAVHHGDDAEAREQMARASVYGGLCLGPVNTAAVHALAYPLGGEFHVAHGLSNAILLPAVFRFNAEAAPERHAEVAVALGAEVGTTSLATAFAGAEKLQMLTKSCGISIDLAEYGISREAVPSMAAAAMTVTRLLRNNPRELTQSDAEQIYQQCFAK
jgi:alcohol dehydrogenase class IV